jgi:hypothetical protein
MTQHKTEGRFGEKRATASEVQAAPKLAIDACSLNRSPSQMNERAIVPHGCHG